MPKVIKFSLPLNNKRIRFLEELKDNFVIDEVVELFHAQTLQHWLACREYTNELKQVKALEGKNQRELVQGLIKVFGVSMGQADLELVLKSMEFRQDFDGAHERYAELGDKLLQIADDRKQQYYQLIEDIKENHDSLEEIRKLLQQIVDRYFDLFSLNFIAFFSRVRDAAPLALIAVLMHEKTRCFFLRSEPIAGDTPAVVRYDPWGLNYILERINQKVSDYPEDFAKCIKECRGATDGYWKDLEAKGTKCMVLSCYSDCYVRDAGKVGGDISGRDANQKYLILDGLDYKGNSSSFVRYVVI